MPWESLITAISSNIVAVITAIIIAAGSIIGIIITQYLRVKKEIELRREIEVFDRKQDLYRKILDQINQLMDYSYYLGRDMNWKISRKIYDELLLIGSEEVIEYFPELHKEMSNKDSTIEEHLYNVRNAIRKDLYFKELKRKFSRVTTLGNKSKRILEKYEKDLKKLQDNGMKISKSCQR